MCEEDVVDFNPGDLHGGGKNKGLATQDLSRLDLKAITPLTPEVMSRQATFNIGTIGHVAHGKSTLVKAVSGVRTTKFKREAIQNITIHLGYANAKIFQCPKCAKPACYHAFGSAQPDQTACPNCGTIMTLQRHVSFVDCPGHDILMATMLNGAAIMDAALLLIAGNEPCPQPQTLEHLQAVQIMKLKNIIVCQNKVDLIKEMALREHYGQIQAVLKSCGLKAPVVPVSAQLRCNIDVVLEYLCDPVVIPVPQRDFLSPPQMIVVRSFDINKPGEEVDNLLGGVAGGSLLRGVLQIGQEIEVRPGIVDKNAAGQFIIHPLRSRVVSLNSETNELQYAVPGGLIGVGTKIDPALTRHNKLVGNLILSGNRDQMPQVYHEIEITFHLLQKLVGVKQSSTTKVQKIQPLVKGDLLQINIRSLTACANVIESTGDTAKLRLNDPVCTQQGEKLALSKQFDRRWRLIGHGSVRRGAALDPNL